MSLCRGCLFSKYYVFMRNVVRNGNKHNFVCYLIETKCNYYQDMCITEKYRPESGLEPRVSRLTYECSTTELSKPTQFCYSNLGFYLTTLSVVSRVCVGVCVCGGGGGGGGYVPLRRSRAAGVRAWHMHVCM